eukprot:6443297-Pyramimonas_sp.AAC.1
MKTTRGTEEKRAFLVCSADCRSVYPVPYALCLYGVHTSNITSLVFTGPPVPVTARVHTKPQRAIPGVHT